jgi:alpha-1,2-mannosyltransferase
MAAGVITIAHDSGGPKLDIVVPASGPAKVGFLASTPEQYADAMREVFSGPMDGQIQERAREASKKFSEQAFDITVTSLLPAWKT